MFLGLNWRTICNIALIILRRWTKWLKWRLKSPKLKASWWRTLRRRVSNFHYLHVYLDINVYILESKYSLGLFNVEIPISDILRMILKFILFVLDFFYMLLCLTMQFSLGAVIYCCICFYSNKSGGHHNVMKTSRRKFWNYYQTYD